jgi:23S rRNA pseudouridine2604 synthase
LITGKPLKPSTVVKMQPGYLRFILREGKNRQIRRMCGQVGLHVTDLQRIRIGPLRLGNLPEGLWRWLSPNELSDMLSYLN